MIEIEFPDAEISKCECCGGTTTRLTRFVTQDGDAFAFYYAAFSEKHPENGVIGVISIGECGMVLIPSRVTLLPFDSGKVKKITTSQ